MEGVQADGGTDNTVALRSVAQVPKWLIGQRQTCLLTGGGEKSLASQGTEEERERLCHFLEEEKGALAGQRVTALKSLSKGTWRADLQLVQVATKKGSVWAACGHSHEGQTVLGPEEALFLMECGSLEVACSGVPMSVQQAYSTLLGDKDWAPYQVYAFLKRLGYGVRVTLMRLPQETEKLPQETERLPQEETEEREECRQLGDRVIFSSCPLCHHLPSAQQQNMTKALEVYQPRPRVSSAPPDFRVIVTRPSAPFPSPHLLRFLSRLHPPAPLKLCPVDGTTIAFYSINSAKIQSLIS